MQDKFIYENFYSYVKDIEVDKWKIGVEPISSTNVLILSISWIAVDNIYSNFFAKEYSFGT
jgi:hypothetical protein